MNVMSFPQVTSGTITVILTSILTFSFTIFMIVISSAPINRKKKGSLCKKKPGGEELLTCYGIIRGCANQMAFFFTKNP